MNNPLTRRYLREFVPAMRGYMIVLPISITLLLMVACQQRCKAQWRCCRCCL